MVSHYNIMSPQMVSPHNGDTQGELPPSYRCHCLKDKVQVPIFALNKTILNLRAVKVLLLPELV